MNEMLLITTPIDVWKSFWHSPPTSNTSIEALYLILSSFSRRADDSWREADCS